MNTTTEITTKRKYTRRSPEEIAAEKAAKEAKKAEREAAKLAKAAEPKAKKEAVVKSAKADKPTSSDDGGAKPKKGNGQKVITPKRGSWNDPTDCLITNKMHVEIKLIEPALGTNPSDKELLETYIASRAPDKESFDEEMSAADNRDDMDRKTTVFAVGYFMPEEHRMVDILDRHVKNKYKDITLDDERLCRLPHFWNYQLRGMMKDACGLLARGNYGESAQMKAFKKVIDGTIMVHPRRIAIELPEWYYDAVEGCMKKSDPMNLRINQRPLRAQGPQGERVAIAASEEIPVGSTMKFTIEYLNPKDRDVIIEWLNYGSIHGLGAWRNSGMGSFIWREINEDYSPIEVEEE